DAAGGEGYRPVRPAPGGLLDMEKPQVMGAEDGLEKGPLAALELQVVEIHAGHFRADIAGDMDDPPIPGRRQVVHQKTIEGGAGEVLEGKGEIEPVAGDDALAERRHGGVHHAVDRRSPRLDAEGG